MLDDNDAELRRDIGLLLARRHGIAHGLNEGLSTQRALELMNASLYVADWLILRLNPDASRQALKSP